MDEGSLGGVIALSIIVPSYGDDELLLNLLHDLSHQKFLGSKVDFEVVVASYGGNGLPSSQSYSFPVKYINCPRPGRGEQMNFAVQSARGCDYFFLHADSKLPDEFFLQKNYSYFLAQKKLLGDRGDRLAGHCGIDFDLPSDMNQELRKKFSYYERKSRLGREETINGDQGLLLSKEFFQQLGGFNTRFNFLEDQFISREIFKQGQWLLLPSSLTTSVRRFLEEGLFKRMFLNALIMNMFIREWWPFLEQAKSAYRPPVARANDSKHAKTFFLLPFISLALKVCWQDQHSWDRLYQACRLVRAQLWQVFFWFDREGETRLLDFYDQQLEKRLDNCFLNCLSVIVVLTLFSSFYIFYGPSEWMAKKEAEF